MISVLVSLFLSLRSCLRSRAVLQLELLALRHQLQVLNRSRPRRLRLVTADRWLWAWLSRSWTAWRTALVIVQPETVIAWHRQGFRVFWTWKSRRRTGRPPLAADVRALSGARMYLFDLDSHRSRRDTDSVVHRWRSGADDRRRPAIRRLR